MTIKKADPDQFQAVRAFYHAVIDAVGNARDSVGWKKDIYPSPELLERSIRAGELFVAVEGDAIIGAMILNHQYNDEYRKAPWPTQADDAEVSVIHALGVHPASRGKGCARQMVQFAIDYARSCGQKVIRLDVLKGNLLAGKLYAGMGFQRFYTLPMFYEDTGWTDFQLYEFRL